MSTRRIPMSMTDDLSGPRQTHVELSFGELARRCGAEPPHVFLISEMPKGKIVWEAFEAPGVRRVVAYAMHPETYWRACEEAYRQWGTGMDGIEGAQPAMQTPPMIGREIVVMIHKPMSVLPPNDPSVAGAWESPFYEWRISI